MKHLLFALFSLFVFNGFACLNESGTNLTQETEIELGSDIDEPTGLTEEASGMDDLNEIIEPTAEEEPKKKRKIIKGLIYYLGGGFVLLLIGMIYFIRKKPKTP